MWGRILLRILTSTCSQYALRISLQKLERIYLMSLSRPVISHNHMLWPSVYLSCQLSGDKNIKDSCDSRGMTLEIMWHQNLNRVLVTERHWEVTHTSHHKGPVHIEANPKDRIAWIAQVLLCSGSILRCRAKDSDINTLKRGSRAQMKAVEHHLGHWYTLPSKTLKSIGSN